MKPVLHNKCKAERIDAMGDDLRVVNAARVSFGKWRDTFGESDAKLLHYLARNEHWTPFSQVIVTLRVSAPIFVARQWYRSNAGVTRNEESRRYVDAPPEFYVPDVFHRRPEGSLKQGCGATIEFQAAGRVEAELRAKAALSAYMNDIQSGLAPEEARMFLPQNTMTQWVETGSLAYFARVVNLRKDSHAQTAIRQLAAEVENCVVDVAPVSWAALMGETN